jgi:hypothetical protein
MAILTMPLAVLFASGVAGAKSGAPKQLTFTAVLNGGQVIPPSTSNALGVGFLTFDEQTKRLCYSISYSTLEGFETQAHLHGGSVGTTDAVFFDLDLGSPKLGCVGPFEPKQEKMLKRGETYINIHTSVWVAGELRGQVLPARGVR